MKLTENFKLSEFIKSRFFDEETQKKVIQDVFKNEDVLLPNIHKLANQLQVLRDHFNSPIIINIAYRPKWYEVEKGRSGNSKHVLGIAADFNVKDKTTKEVREAIEELILNGEMLQGGLGKYNTFVHYDCFNGGKRRW